MDPHRNPFAPDIGSPPPSLRTRQPCGDGILCMPLEAPEGQSLPTMLLPALRTAMLKLDRGQAPMTLAKRSWARFVKAFKLSYGEFEASFKLGEVGVADNGDLEAEISDLIDLAGAAAAERETALVLFFDELQYVPARLPRWMSTWPTPRRSPHSTTASSVFVSSV